jgi:hypothetical protein
MTLLRGIGRFVYDFIIGDDWKIAAAVLSALLTGMLLLIAGVPPTLTAIVTAGLVATAFTAALVIDVRHTARRLARRR